MKAWYWPVLLLVACGDPQGPPPARVGEPKQVTDTALVGFNRRVAQREALEIDRWIARQGMAMESSGTGLRYRVLRDVAGATARPGQYADVRYALLLLNGDTAYRSAPGKLERFLVEEDNVESGLHEGIQYLSPGDSAWLVIPSHLAHGLLGDQDRIPPRSTVVYCIALDHLTTP